MIDKGCRTVRIETKDYLLLLFSLVFIRNFIILLRSIRFAVELSPPVDRAYRQRFALPASSYLHRTVRYTEVEARRMDQIPFTKASQGKLTSQQR